MSELLEDAKDLQALFSEPDRWTKLDLFGTDAEGNDCCYCLLGGIDKVTGMLDADFNLPFHVRRSMRQRVIELEQAVEAVIVEEIGDECYTGIADWNDADERTVEDVQRVTNQVVERVS